MVIFERVVVHPDCNNRFCNFTLTSVNTNVTARSRNSIVREQ